jgi:hypothetical protein
MSEPHKVVHVLLPEEAHRILKRRAEELDMRVPLLARQDIERANTTGPGRPDVERPPFGHELERIHKWFLCEEEMDLLCVGNGENYLHHVYQNRNLIYTPGEVIEGTHVGPDVHVMKQADIVHLQSEWSAYSNWRDQNPGKRVADLYATKTGGEKLDALVSFRLTRTERELLDQWATRSKMAKAGEAMSVANFVRTLVLEGLENRGQILPDGTCMPPLPAHKKAEEPARPAIPDSGWPFGGATFDDHLIHLRKYGMHDEADIQEGNFQEEIDRGLHPYIRMVDGKRTYPPEPANASYANPLPTTPPWAPLPPGDASFLTDPRLLFPPGPPEDHIPPDHLAVLDAQLAASRPPS